jgi:hypothetical protein
VEGVARLHASIAIVDFFQVLQKVWKVELGAYTGQLGWSTSGRDDGRHLPNGERRNVGVDAVIIRGNHRTLVRKGTM